MLPPSVCLIPQLWLAWFKWHLLPAAPCSTLALPGLSFLWTAISRGAGTTYLFVYAFILSRFQALGSKDLIANFYSSPSGAQHHGPKHTCWQNLPYHCRGRKSEAELWGSICLCGNLQFWALGRTYIHSLWLNMTPGMTTRDSTQELQANGKSLSSLHNFADHTPLLLCLRYTMVERKRI